ncbi:MAG: hypothetical protein QGG73_13605, partial [Candidatus Hydrogenedentes bacterium]|nr:hypothetical protein [Candidatus Hydrogenedentota bacterium]
MTARHVDEGRKWQTFPGKMQEKGRRAFVCADPLVLRIFRERLRPERTGFSLPCSRRLSLRNRNVLDGPYGLKTDGVIFAA